jgi:rare lipoprotein A
VVVLYNQGIPTANGPITASGEGFSPSTLTAAHKSLPFGTRVRITNVDTGQSVDVRVNDRGAYTGGRCFTLTAAGYGALAGPQQSQVNATWVII